MPPTQSRELSFNIRSATAADTDFILSLVPRLVAFDLPKGHRKRDVLAAIRAEIERALHDPRPSEHFFIAEGVASGRAGFLHLRVQRDFLSGRRACHISNLVVANEHDGEGIGRALLAHAQKWAKAHRCTLLTLSVFPCNTRARALYESMGFGPDLLRMIKPLR